MELINLWRFFQMQCSYLCEISHNNLWLILFLFLWSFLLLPLFPLPPHPPPLLFSPLSFLCSLAIISPLQWNKRIVFCLSLIKGVHIRENFVPNLHLSHLINFFVFYLIIVSAFVDFKKWFFLFHGFYRWNGWTSCWVNCGLLLQM